MDANLVEKITRLVIANLEEYSNAHAIKEDSTNKTNNQFSSVDNSSRYHPLSKAEIEEWEAISRVIGDPKKKGNSYLNPLNEAELQTWKSISSKILNTSKGNIHEAAQDKVKFFPHH
ncbi:hypothetical protein V7138_07050 [Bacillus sp. JJ1533]|uniref:hypothetical protein n=1 Tax=Bacillus sp. JJ1533 TaxID=3122959 RepID=UPI002FFE356F